MSAEVYELKIDEILTTVEHAVKLEVADDLGIPAITINPPTCPKIMMVDDEKLNILVVAEYLKADGYRDFVYTDQPFQAMALAGSEIPDAILLDIHMPHLTGLDILQLIRADHTLARTPVVIITSSTDDEEKLRALEMGATDFLHKPIHSGELLARLRNILMAKAYQDHWQNYASSLAAAVKQRTAELEASHKDVIHCLARAAEFRDDDTGRHVVRVGCYARIIGEQLGMNEPMLDALEQAAKLHDIGKIGLPDEIMLKPGALTPQEFEAMQKHTNYAKQIINSIGDNGKRQLRQHAELGARILDLGESPLLSLASRIALTHHERWDGTGYPIGLAGNDIPLEGRITAVADVFDALSTKRPYKPAYPLDKCFSIMLEGRGTHFDPRVVDAFFERRDRIIETQIALAEIA
jgi:putative two-component system response regulator